VIRRLSAWRTRANRRNSYLRIQALSLIVVLHLSISSHRKKSRLVLAEKPIWTFSDIFSARKNKSPGRNWFKNMEADRKVGESPKK
jgi:hypothetical protein